MRDRVVGDDVRPTHYGPVIGEVDGEVLGDPEADVVNAIVEGGHGFVFSFHGLTRSERRRAKHMYAVDWAIRTGRDRVIWTPSQRLAVWLFYRVGMKESHGAKALRITRQAFEERLSGAEAQADRWYAAEDPPRYRVKKGRPNAKVPESLDGTEPGPRPDSDMGTPDPDTSRRPGSLSRSPDNGSSSEGIGKGRSPESVLAAKNTPRRSAGISRPALLGAAEHGSPTTSSAPQQARAGRPAEGRGPAW